MTVDTRPVSIPVEGLAGSQSAVALEDAATAVVEDLRAGSKLSRVPEDVAGWNRAFVRAIRVLKERYRGSPDLGRLLRIASEQLYGKDVHWALELIQNAEDAGAKHIVFVFEHDRVLVSNDGEPFSAEDVWAICSAGHSAKKNKIGFFGIGFKSVFKLTDAPEIRSGHYALRLEEKIYPTPLDVDDPVRPRGARFTLPVRPSERERLPSMLGDLTSPEFLHLLLTLENLQTIRVFDRTGAGRSGRFQRVVTTVGPRGAWDECEISGTWPGCDAQTWRRHRSRTDEIPSGISREGREFAEGERSVIVLARPTDSPPIPTNLHCFLPLDVPSELQWLLQADFDPTPGRERLRDNAWNRWLMDQIGTSLAAAVLSEGRSGKAPWPWIALAEEVRSPLQRIAFDREQAALSELAFVKTNRGLRTPDRATWGVHPELPEIVREADLPTTGRDVSYVSPSIIGQAGTASRERAERVMTQLGSSSIELTDLITVLRAPDKLFYADGREGRWWLSALDLIARHADSTERSELARVRCLPVQGPQGRPRRVAPSPIVSDAGYLVAFSRSDNLEDLRTFFGDSQIYLIDRYLTPPRSERKRTVDDGAQDARGRVRRLLEAEPFGVAPEAGPYHVVNHLVLPRMRALSREEHLSSAQTDQLWRLFEYSRQKWPSYVAGYRRWRSDKEDVELAASMGSELMVVGVETLGRTVRHHAVPANRAYLSSALLGHDGMDVVLSGLPGIDVIDPIHSRVVSTRSRRRGGRRGGRVMSSVEFLRHLGAPVGPRVERNPHWTQSYRVHEMSPHDIDWVDWSGVPHARGRVGLQDDWVSADIDRLAERWPSFGRKNQLKRARALWQSLQADWDRLDTSAYAQPVFFYYQWNPLGGPTSASWVATLRRFAWVRAESGELVPPPSLVLDTRNNRLGVAGDENALLGLPAPPPGMAAALGIAEQPSVDTVLATLSHLRGVSETAEGSQVLVTARACYELLAHAVRKAESPSERKELTERLGRQFQGNSQVGLVYAPPPQGFAGKAWWPSSRVVQGDFGSVAGPYIGQLAGRYPRAAPLWDALGLESQLSPRVVVDLIERELVNDPDDVRARDYYGRLVAHLESLGGGALGERQLVKALSNNGWVPAAEVWWTSRAEVESAFGLRLNWWVPGSLDPSTLRAAADWMGIRELRRSAEGGSLTERWSIASPESPEAGVEDAWERAASLWPDVLRAEAPGSDDDVLTQLTAIVRALQPRVARHIHGELQVSLSNGASVRASTEPRVLLRRARSELVARDTEDLFSRQAAETLATLVPARRLQAANTLAGLLSDALHSPEVLARQSAKYGGARQAEASFVFQAPPDDDELDETPELLRDLRAGKRIAAPRREARVPEPERPVQPLASPMVYELVSVKYSSKAAEPAEPRIAAQKLRAPLTAVDDDPPEDATPPEPPVPSARYSNIDIEDAARWFVEEFERSQGRTVVRQDDLVGADFVANDGRYIEVKAFSATSEGFDLEPAEWRVARRSDVGPQYWVYVVEHLRDGQAPVVSAIFNPILDESVTTEPTGKLRVRRWRSATTVATATFRERDGVDRA